MFEPPPLAGGRAFEVEQVGSIQVAMVKNACERTNRLTSSPFILEA